ncbi:hypothetical protein CFC21_080974 [Triticum aestivum]|uniref:Nucleotide-diphospho-sugar transferase domain-containing protein n=2 Tax=Triticum aestivum TaxID=4565 RepID=A0A3B6N2U8_WHEAT|nr:uncharacterized protein At4g15970-like [Triticum aestivum]KAF7076303.1 hypothetical protein CFC21_080974 [Triticum aestivum]
MGKVVVAEATARQVAAFVVGAVAALTVVMLVQYRAPAAGLSRARTPGHFSGLRSSSDDQHHRPNGTTARAHVHQAPPVAGGPGRDDDHHLHRPANATTITKPNSTSTHAAPSHLSSTHRRRQKGPKEESAEFRGLAAAVARAATDDRTVIITCVNQAWAAPGSLLDLFLESFRIGDGTARLLPHVLVVAMDPGAHSRCLAVHQHCYHYTIPGLNIDFAALKYFLSKDYLELVWSKLKLQRRILELGYGFLFTDVDIMWLRDPFKHVTAYADMTVSSDVYFGDPDNLDNFPNTGFFHVKPNARTIAMTKLWHGARGKYPGANEQPVFNMMKKRMVKKLGLRVQYLDPVYVGGFCRYGKDLGKIVTMHANCCVGIDNKIRDLKGVLDDWKNYTRLPHWEKHRAKWTVPGACIRAEKQA